MDTYQTNPTIPSGDEKNPVLWTRKIDVFKVIIKGSTGVDLFDDSIFEMSGISNKWLVNKTFNVMTFTLSYADHIPNYQTIYNKMYIYKAAMELENILLMHIINESSSPFTVKVEADRGIFERYITTAVDSIERRTSEWLNNETMWRVYDWVTTVIPTYTHNYITDEIIDSLDDIYDMERAEFISFDDALKDKQSNIIFIQHTLSKQTGKVNSVAHLLNSQKVQNVINDSSSFRKVCKTMGSLSSENIIEGLNLYDLKYAGLPFNLLIRDELLANSIFEHHRVFSTFESFGNFVGLLSDEAQVDVIGADHCNQVSPIPSFKTVGITKCGGSVRIYQKGRRCYSEGRVFRTLKDSCGNQNNYIGYSDTNIETKDGICCRLDLRYSSEIVSILNMYRNRTVNSGNSSYLPLLKDTEEWFNEEFPQNENYEISGRYSAIAFSQFKPICKLLEITLDEQDNMNLVMPAYHDMITNGLIYDVQIEDLREDLEDDDIHMLLKSVALNKTQVHIHESDVNSKNLGKIISKYENLENKDIEITYGYGLDMVDDEYDTEDEEIQAINDRFNTKMNGLNISLRSFGFKGKSNDDSHILTKNHVNVKIRRDSRQFISVKIGVENKYVKPSDRNQNVTGSKRSRIN